METIKRENYYNEQEQIDKYYRRNYPPRSALLLDVARFNSDT